MRTLSKTQLALVGVLSPMAAALGAAIGTALSMLMGLR